MSRQDETRPAPTGRGPKGFLFDDELPKNSASADSDQLATHRLAGESVEAREEFIGRQAEALAERSGVTIRAHARERTGTGMRAIAQQFKKARRTSAGWFLNVVTRAPLNWWLRRDQSSREKRDEPRCVT
jgi:hypothetical protein